ncbi:hypothetical protein AB1Y20_010513 [Prymnesium parvum]|uniref:J domain-containing protein n=1 Tax=Prymnesium parvum TaxID=97485 RepID=A0AB34IS55_PRYPA
MDLLAAVLAAEDSFAVLGFPSSSAEPIPPADVRSAFRRRALQCHPDKSDDARAPEAFRKLTEAFEALHDPQEQARARRDVSARSAPPQPKRRRTEAASRSWGEWERELRRREEIERSFHSLQRARYADRQAGAVLRKAERVCDELDERAGITGNELTREGRVGEAEEGQASRSLEEACAAAAAAADPRRLVQLLSYLRATHRYCLFCATTFNSDDDMLQNCPGLLEEAHENGQEDAAADEACWDDDDYS